MIGRFIGRFRASERFARDLYTTIVAQARQPALYRRLAVPDTVDGRFEMVVLHTVLLFHRLRPEGQEGQDLAQRVFNLFVTDMDMSLREMGVGDFGVPKRMKDVGRSFYGRIDTYGKPFADLDQSKLSEALHRNLFPTEPETPVLTEDLAHYLIAASVTLNEISFADLKSGEIGFPEPAVATMLG
ncbi:MAG: ubiquinol-cytochrome C chaperone family protein [Alphaproteobacteria bacterium]